MTKELETQIQELETKLQAKEEELKKFWKDKEKITWTEEEIKIEKNRTQKTNENYKNLSTKEIWTKLVEKYQKEYPEQMAKIDISDLTELALQVNDENIHDYEFLKQFCSEEPRLFFEICEGLKAPILDQLANRVLARCLIEKYGEVWKLSEKYSTEKTTINYFTNRILLCENIKTNANLGENKCFREIESRAKNLNKIANQEKTELNTKKRELEQAKEQIKNQLTAEKTAAIQKLETEKNQKIRELEQTKEQIRQQVLQERQKLENKLREKVNRKLEKGNYFKPGKQGGDLEEATDNLLEKQQQLENEIYNLKRDIGGIYQQLKEEKEKHANEKLQLKARIDKVVSEKNLLFDYNSGSLEEAIDKIFSNQKHVNSTGDKCLSVVTAPFKWVSNKVGTGLALAGFMTVLPTILVGLGWVLKAFLVVKTGGVAGAAMVANSMVNHGSANNNNLPPNYQPLPPAENTPNLPPVINNHYHLPDKKGKKNNWKKKKKDSS